MRTPTPLQRIAELSGAALRTVGDAVPQSIHELAFDSRSIHDAAHTLFLALGSSHRDGHQFLQDAWDKGVRHFWVSRPEAMTLPGVYLLSADVLAALQLWASAHRQQFSYPVIGITGSNGKTIVKEWLTTLVEPWHTVVKSPKSYNSALGIPLSLLELHDEADCALIEVGISRNGEMVDRANWVQPTHGILTHLGDAHADGFASQEEKVTEKLKLFASCKSHLRLSQLQTLPDGSFTATCEEVSSTGTSVVLSATAQRLAAGWEITANWPHTSHTTQCILPVPGEAALENALLAMGAAHTLCALSPAQVSARVPALFPVTMRTEMITDNPEVTVINDAYNADASSIHNAMDLLAAEASQPGRLLILTDLEHQGRRQEEVQRQVMEEALRRFGAEQVMLVGPVFSKLAEGQQVRAFITTQDLLTALDYEAVRQHTVLLKGARSFALERIIPFLTRRAVATQFRISMNALADNFRWFRSHLPKGTRIMAMVKAFSYGSGTWEIARRLEQEGVDHLAVAYTVEGIALRTRGIRTPVLVLNPDDASLEQLLHFHLEPEVFSLSFLERYLHAGRLAGAAALPVHLKVDTGMGRLGFHWQQTDALTALLRANPVLQVRSVMSHLASADEPSQDAYTHAQAEKFLAFHKAISEATGTQPMRHLLNTAGSLRFPQYAFEMVRLGIGLYGVNPAPGTPAGLQEIGSLHSHISQIHEYPAGTFVGYGCSQSTTRPSRIATVPIGYADGIRRSLGNGRMAFLIRGHRAPTFGRICMDMLMLDVTDVPQATEGDEVILLGRQGNDHISANDLAERCGTISYEILTGISGRVQRLYDRE